MRDTVGRSYGVSFIVRIIQHLWKKTETTVRMRRSCVRENMAFCAQSTKTGEKIGREVPFLGNRLRYNKHEI